MPKHLYLVLLLTFALGFMVGFFVYIENRTAKEAAMTEDAQKETQKGFEVLGYTYGGCERVGCTSYRIADDGAYTYIVRNSSGQDVRHMDAITKKQLTDLNEFLKGADLDAIEASIYTGSCPVAYDGLAYRYEIRRAGERYSFDSCTQNLEGTPLFLLLSDYFEIFNAMYHRE